MLAPELRPWIASTGQNGSRYSMQEFAGDGARTSFEFNFAGGYIDPENVRAYVYVEETGVQTPVSPVVLTGPNTISVVPAVPNGSFLVVYRDTEKSRPLVDFADGAVMSEANLDKVAQQAVFATAEMVDRFYMTEQLVDELSTEAQEATARSELALETANDAKTLADSAVRTAGEALAGVAGAEQAAIDATNAAQAATEAANNANQTAADVRGIAQSAEDKADAAVAVAEGIDGKAQAALEASGEAVGAANQAAATAGQAIATANGIDAKAQTALDTSQSAAQQAAAAIPASQKGVAGGVAPLDSGGRLSASRLPTITESLWNGTTLNLMPGGRFVEGNFDGFHTSTTLSLRQGQPSTTVTYLPIVPPAGGNSAYTICRSAAAADSSFVALGINGTALMADLTFSRHGTAGAPGALRIFSTTTECGRIGSDATWIFGPYLFVPNIQARAFVYHTGGSLQYGMVFRPQLFENSVAIQFQAYNGAVAGYIQSNSNLSTQYATTSDYRSKTVLGEVDPADAIARVMRMRPVYFRMNGAAVVTRPLTGFVAHELQEVEHQAVTGHKDETRENEDGETVPVMQGVDLSKIVPTLVAAIQEQQRRIDGLTQRLNAITGTT